MEEVSLAGLLGAGAGCMATCIYLGTELATYATGLSAVVIGKPSSSFFMSALQDLQVEPEEAVMVGDDVLNDVGGAQRCGLMGILVRTGKYRTEDEERDDVKPDQVVGNLAAAVNYILGTCTLQD